jgi:hypothetical protein
MFQVVGYPLATNWQNSMGFRICDLLKRKMATCRNDKSPYGV